MPQDLIFPPDAPAIKGLSFRHFRGESDYPGMLAVLLASAKADQIERSDTVEDIAKNYQRLTHCDPYQDMIFAEIEGDLIGYGRGWWQDDLAAGRVYETVGFLVPSWRRKGIGRTMLHWLEDRLRTLAAEHPGDRPCFFQDSAKQSQEGTRLMLERAGYQPVRYFIEMVRPSLDNIPELPMPVGLELRPVRPEHYPAIWSNIDENSQDEWGYTPPTEEAYRAWLEDETHFQPHLWQVAWDLSSGKIAGHVLTFIDHEQNRRLGQKRGYTEGIGVSRAWRRRGLARALIARSLQAQKAEGILESALNVDSDNNSTRLYESCGFQAVQRDTIYRKPF